MIDPIDSLAFSIQANPGVYALLLGSGVSRAAQIPTGWEITLDLTRKLAAAAGEPAEPDPETWYGEKFGEAPDYSKLIGNLAKTQSERQQLLRPYFEPSQQEREEGAKQPTAAHRAVARLVAQGFVKVVITTNFDRLIEKALEEAGVEPTVLSSPDQVKGMLPLVHVQHCVIKLHGDYLDTRIRNTPSELEEYPDEINHVLEQVFDEFGLTVCGWSAAWDLALRDAMLRAESRRFTAYWAVHGQPSDNAQRLISHRHAEVIDIDGADKFFETIQQKVEAIEHFSQPHPLSTQQALASLKRYIADPRYRIQRTDLIESSVDEAVEAVAAHAFDMNNPNPNSKTVTARLRAYEAACTTLLAIAATAGRWAEEGHFGEWRRTLERLSTFPIANGYTIWIDLRRYPATLLLYSLGIGAVASENFDFVGHLFRATVSDEAKSGESTPFLTKIVDGLHHFYQRELLEGMERRAVSISDWLYDALREPLRYTIADDARYAYAFDEFEVLLSMAFYKANGDWKDWFPLGSFVHRIDNRERILASIDQSIGEVGDNASLVSSGIVGNTAAECAEVIQYFREYMARVSRRYGLFY